MRRLTRERDRSADARVYRRTLAVLELDRGRPAADIAAMLGVTRQSVHNWAATFAGDADPAALADRHRSGRPPVLFEQTDCALRSLMPRSPQDLGYPDTGWTVPLLQREMEKDPGIRPRMTRSAGASTASGTCGSGRATSWPRTPSARKKRRIRRQIRGLPRRSVVLAEDETDLLLFPPLRAAWSLSGRAGGGPHQRAERPAGDLRGHEPPDRDAVVPGAAQGAGR